MCEVDTTETCGPLGGGYVHVRPLASGEERETDPVDDPVPVCPNGHAMLHRGRRADDPMPVGELRAVMRARRAVGPR